MKNTIVTSHRVRASRASQARRAFTLVELLVVVGIIVLLVAILLPTLHNARIASQDAVCLSNLRQIGQATIAYRDDTHHLPFFFFLRNGSAPVPPTGTGS